MRELPAVSTPRRSGTRGYAHLVEVNAPVARVWKALTDPALIRIWTGSDARIDARQGGSFTFGKSGNDVREAHVDIFEVNRRLRLIYMQGRHLPRCDSAIVDDFLLDVRGPEGSTSLRVLGSGIPVSQEWDAAYARMRMGWERYLTRIKAALENPPPPRTPRAAKKVDPGLPGLDF
jgi:uncharacterized protein YndB with AHSA1/START domain